MSSGSDSASPPPRPDGRPANSFVAPDGVHRRFLHAAQKLTGADGVSLLLWLSSSSPLLAHLDKGTSLPAFADVESALSLVDRLADTTTADADAPLKVFTVMDDGLLLRVPVDALAASEPSPAPVGRERRRPCQRNSTDVLWLALRYTGAEVPPAVLGLNAIQEIESDNPSHWLANTLSACAAVVTDASRALHLFRDPTSQLPGPAEFQARLQALHAEAREDKSTLGLLLVNPDDFGLINQRIDREAGDGALAEIAGVLRDNLRGEDLLFRYGGAVFAVLLPRLTGDEVEAVAGKIRRTLAGTYLDGAVRLNFSVASAIYRWDEPGDAAPDHIGLLRRADHALNRAKRLGGGCVVAWNSDDSDMHGSGQDRLSGIFTADTEKDYRNMLLLWDTIAVLSSAETEQDIASTFIDRVGLALKPGRAALIVAEEGQDHRVLASAGDDTGVLLLGPEQKQLLKEVQERGSTERLHFTQQAPGGRAPRSVVAYAVPLRAGERHLGTLYIDGPEHSLSLDSSDLYFLDALCGQVGLALDRADLAGRWREQTETESRRLRREVQELRQVVHSARMVYSSPAMQAVMDTLRAVAPTDVTILINGESGTGKELLARSVHEMSNRRDKPLVTVDCGAISHSLMEAELFGRVKGAYTGADQAAPGRIAQADGGTLFLDEVGEIPVEVQAKLLRFVQEKEISPVGASTTRTVDVRIVAATNRDLEREVAAGRFRQDLFYRLKVVTLVSPPLRERRDDVLPLSVYFLEKFAHQYDKRVNHFSPEAEQCLQRYDWPGNVRELQNSILRAVVLSTGETLDAQLLQFDEGGATGTWQAGAGQAHEGQADDGQAAGGPETRGRTDAEPAGESPGFQSTVHARATGDAAAPPAGASPGTAAAATPPGAGSAPGTDPWIALQRGVYAQVAQLMAGPRVDPVPMGRWLGEDLVLAADRRMDGVSRRAAAMLGVAETTYRRQLDAVKTARAQSLLVRTPAWAEVQPLLDALVSSLGEHAAENLLERARDAMLEAVTSQVQGNDRMGAALMGITVPTYRRWRA